MTTVSEHSAPVHDFRRWAVGGMVGGAVTSVAANVAHVFVPPTVHGHPVTGWHPDPGAVLASVIWPLALLAASEVLARKRWASTITRVIGGVSVLIVATVAAVISYQHLYALLLHYGESELSARIGPLGIDGLMLVCSVALVARNAQVRADTVTDTAPSTVTDTVVTPTASTSLITPVPAVSALPAGSASTAAITVTVPDMASTPTPMDTVTDPSDTVLAERLRTSGTRTLRGAMTELGIGQTRARRVLALAFPPDT